MCASYARLVTCVHQSAGKQRGTGGATMGHVHLTRAFSEAAVLFLRQTNRDHAGRTERHEPTIMSPRSGSEQP